MWKLTILLQGSNGLELKSKSEKEIRCISDSIMEGSINEHELVRFTFEGQAVEIFRKAIVGTVIEFVKP